MADTFKLSVLTPKTEVFTGVVTTVSVSGDEGEFGVLPGHYAYITAVRPGVLEITVGNETKVYAVGHGFAQVAADKVSMVVASCDDASKVDVTAERARLAAAEAVLVDREPGETGFAQAELEQAIALGRLIAADRVSPS